MVCDRRGHSRDGNCEAQVQQVAQSQSTDLRPADRTAVVLPKAYRHETRGARNETSGHEHQGLGCNAKDVGDRALQLQLQGARLSIARHHANGDERQQEDRDDFVRRKRRRPHAQER
jgi:hypothetical protein